MLTSSSAKDPIGVDSGNARGQRKEGSRFLASTRLFMDSLMR
jgi:hypothetical protein